MQIRRPWPLTPLFLFSGLLFTSFASAATTTVLHNFGGGTDGANPVTPLVFGPGGSLYGTTQVGGTGTGCNPGMGCGVIFRLSPEQGGGWTETILYSFAGGSDGSSPSGLTFDSFGNLYGTTAGGGNGNGQGGWYGTVFELAPNPNGSWTKSVIYAFTGGDDGCVPMAGVVFDAAGTLYGTNVSCGASGYDGVIFELIPNGNGGWAESTLYSFTGGTDGWWPEQLIFDKRGNLYGTDLYGGGTKNGSGTVFELKASEGSWTFSVLHAFSGGTDGIFPSYTLALDALGRVFGTAQRGGDLNCGYRHEGCGLVFGWAPNSNGGEEFKILHAFTGKPSSTPVGGVVFDPTGNLWGAAYGSSSIFELTPNGSAGAIFKNVIALDGSGPFAALISDSAGNLYGTTDNGGTSNAGTVFEVIP